MSQLNATGGPVTLNERADILDVLRGFALLGIFLANSAVFSQYVMQQPEVVAAFSTEAIDKWLRYFHFAFIDGKFYSLFSLLFGIGFSVIFFRNKQKGNKGLTIFYRRLFILAIFGLLHIFFLWDGDILFFYALVGMFLPLFRNGKDKTLIILAACLLLSPLLFDLAKVLTDGKWDMSIPFLKAALAHDKTFGLTEDNAGAFLTTHTDYRSILNWNRSGFWFSWFLRLGSNRPVKVLALFLLGLYVGRHFIYSRLQEYKPLLKKVRLFGLGLGIPAGLLHAWFEFDHKRLPAAAGLWDTLFYALNVAPLALGYAATIALWYVNGKYLWILQPLRYAGRMALTNYILQSFFGVVIYYGIGFGLGAQSGPAVFMPIAVGVFLLQVLYSNLWFRYFNYGPLEWIWRILTYGKRLPLRK
ncbi:DUF418 domain-containing protein [Niabella hirudinis]|uniref:DUF418 domain-containing protein n=1 Tax=Niabella hirudinis TaxID=1285929 RepID=UPI003EB77E20